MNEWRFTSLGEVPEDPYSPGTVVGEVQESDLWQILIGIYFWLNAWEAQEGDRQEPYEGYLWKAELKTNFLYDRPDREGFDPTTQRIVSGALATVDELGWMGVAAVFSGEDMQHLLVEVDTDWAIWVTSEFNYSKIRTEWQLQLS